MLRFIKKSEVKHMKAQTKNRTTLIESFIGLKDAFKDAMTMFTNNE